MTASRTILIVTEEFDPHADDVILLLRSLGHQPVRLHTADFPLQSSLSMTLGARERSAWRGTIQAHRHQIDLGDIRSVWWRRPTSYRFPPELSDQEREFARKELDQTLSGLWASLDCYWMSLPHKIRDASYKPEQLQRAIELGFDVPETLITSDPAAAYAFYEQCGGQMIYKPLSQAIFLPDPGPAGEAAPARATYTTPITEAQLAQLETIRLTPCLFQAYVPKARELRVTVIGDDVFTAAIMSQSHDRTRHDWRRYDVEIPYERATLPVEVAVRCHALTRSYGLNFSAIDLIVTPDERYVFLENNPNGQWLFIQDLVPELKMKEALAACLIRGKTAG